jgi:serine protease inhibitor ecotin
MSEASFSMAMMDLGGKVESDSATNRWGASGMDRLHQPISSLQKCDSRKKTSQ